MLSNSSNPVIVPFGELMKQSSPKDHVRTNSAEDSAIDEEFLNSLNDGITVLDENGTVFFVNRTAEEQFGSTRKQITGTHISKHLIEDNKGTSFLEIVEDCFQGNPPPPGEYDFRFFQLKSAKIQIKFFLKEDSARKARQLVLIHRDISTRKNLEGKEDNSDEKKLMTEMKSKAALQLKQDFLSKINHEIKTPMIGVLGFSRLGLERYRKLSREKLKNYFATILESGERLQSILNNLLDLSQLERGNTAYDFQNEKLSLITTIVLNELFNQLHEKQIDVDFKKPNFRDQVQMDVDKIGKVIRDLITNAIEFSGKGSQINIRITRRKDIIQFAVTDSGTEVSDEDLDAVFERPEDSGSGDGKLKERGLGLAISKEIISDHDGRIWVERGKAGGLTFKFVLPKAV